MRKNEPKTPLLALLRTLTPKQRERFAKQARTSVSYLYALSSGDRSPSAQLALRIEQASERMHKNTNGRSPVVTMRELAEMGAS